MGKGHDRLNNDRYLKLHNDRDVVNYNAGSRPLALVPAMSRSLQKQQTRNRILDAAGRGFRKGGFGGIGVDGLAKEAGLTSGAFYVHFGSKADAFREAVVEGLEQLRAGIRGLQDDRGAEWWPAFVRFYLGERRRCDLAESCALQSLSPEMARADAASRACYDGKLGEIVAAITDGPASPGKPAGEAEALVALSLLAGAVTLARAVADPALADRIADAAAATLLRDGDDR